MTTAVAGSLGNHTDRWRSRRSCGVIALHAKSTPMRPTAALRAGLVTNLLNPKVGVFYISILPQFLPTEGGTTLWGVTLVAIHVAVTFAWLPLLIWTANKARQWFLRRKVRAWLDRVTATVLIGVGLKLAAETR